MAPQFGFSMGSSRRGREKVYLSSDHTIYPLMNATEEHRTSIHLSWAINYLLGGCPRLAGLCASKARPTVIIGTKGDAVASTQHQRKTAPVLGLS